MFRGAPYHLPHFPTSLLGERGPRERSKKKSDCEGGYNAIRGVRFRHGSGARAALLLERDRLVAIFQGYHNEKRWNDIGVASAFSSLEILEEKF